MIIRSKTFKQWLLANYSKKRLANLVDCNSAFSGFPELNWYWAAPQLYNKFKDEIWETLGKDAIRLGYSNALAMIADFRGTTSSFAEATVFESLMVWYAAKCIAREVTESNGIRPRLVVSKADFLAQLN